MATFSPFIGLVDGARAYGLGFREKEILINSTFGSRGAKSAFSRSSLGVLSVKSGKV